MPEPDPDTFSSDTVDGQRRMTVELIGHQPVSGRSAAPESLPREVPAAERSTVYRFLDSIDDLVRRHRALAARDGADDILHAELIAAELDQRTAVLRRFLADLADRHRQPAKDSERFPARRGRHGGEAGGMLSVSDRLVAEFAGRVDPPGVAGVVASCEEQLRGQGLPEAALPELVERLARADLVERLADRPNGAARRSARPAPTDR
ncbi:hypothetical protein [Pseudonocardia parietis]|uniref:Uncharacterized protein n=1 Tax=Pseudonocardia parietis TaxID=570936 RepID=A0ABS4W5I8_9PSEU|nr:hypothetical protein [Pseudonocardia parietis]MBP2371473.1 hypothetical protein [Pseudonocardia parietis]